MPYIDEELSISDAQIIAISSKGELAFVIKREIWALFEKHKNESYKGKLWGVIPYSIKVEKVEPILVKFLGANPYA